MPSMLIWLPIQPGQTAAAHAFAAECIGPRYADYNVSERRIGVRIENWYLQHTPTGDNFIIQMEGFDLNASVGAFIASQDPFDVWFKQRVREFTGIELSALPPEMIGETLAEYPAGGTK
jgi:hypothetical protein